MPGATLLDVAQAVDAVARRYGYVHLPDHGGHGIGRSMHEPPFVPNQPAAIDFELPDVYHSFRRGHRLMIQVQSSWFPLVDRNPQKFMEIPKAGPADFQKATQRVYRSRSLGSSVTVMAEGGALRLASDR